MTVYIQMPPFSRPQTLRSYPFRNHSHPQVSLGKFWSISYPPTGGATWPCMIASPITCSECCPHALQEHCHLPTALLYISNAAFEDSEMQNFWKFCATEKCLSDVKGSFSVYMQTHIPFICQSSCVYLGTHFFSPVLKGQRQRGSDMEFCASGS